MIASLWEDLVVVVMSQVWWLGVNAKMGYCERRDKVKVEVRHNKIEHKKWLRQLRLKPSHDLGCHASQ